jgi:hypothetical protein
MVEIFYGIFLFLFILTNAKNKTMQHTPISFTNKLTHTQITQVYT